MGGIFIVAGEESCARATRVEDRDMRVCGFDHSAREGLSGGGRWLVGFHRDVDCENWGVELVGIIGGPRGREDGTLGFRGKSEVR